MAFEKSRGVSLDLGKLPQLGNGDRDPKTMYYKVIEVAESKLLIDAPPGGHFSNYWQF